MRKNTVFSYVKSFCLKRVTYYFSLQQQFLSKIDYLNTMVNFNFLIDNLSHLIGSHFKNMFPSKNIRILTRMPEQGQTVFNNVQGSCIESAILIMLIRFSAMATLLLRDGYETFV